jgi:Tol biopolymer transport system component
MLRRTFLFATAAALAAQESSDRVDGPGSLAYVRGGTLWIKQLPGGQPRAIAAGGEICRPKFSRSGKWILFGDGDDLLHVVSADGKQAMSWPSDTGQWLPGQDQLAVLLNGHTLVFAADDSWKSPRIALPGPPGAISPDGSQRVWESSYDSGTRLLAGPFNRPSEAKLVAETKEGGFQVLGFTRGGNRFLYWTTDEDGADVWAYPLDIYLAGGGQPVNTGAASIMGEDHNMISLSPTADTLALSAGGDNLTNYDKGIALLDLSADSSQPLRTITRPEVSAIYPAFSPDGGKLAWCQGPDANVLFKQLPPGTFYEVADERSARERRIWVAGNGGLGEQKQLTNDPRYWDQLPAWSRDGNHILFVRSGPHYAATLWLMRPDGSDAREVAALSEKDDTSLIYGPDLFDWSFRL